MTTENGRPGPPVTSISIVVLILARRVEAELNAALAPLGLTVSRLGLLGHKDGTANPRPESAEFDAAVWAAPQDEPAWFSGGTYLVFRKIRMDLPKWDTSPAHTQDQAIGRRRDDGARSAAGTSSPLSTSPGPGRTASP